MTDRTEIAAAEVVREIPCEDGNGCAHGYCYCPQELRSQRTVLYNRKLKDIIREQEQTIKSLRDECKALDEAMEDQEQEIDSLRAKLEETERALCIAKRDIKVAHVQGIAKGMGC